MFVLLHPVQIDHIEGDSSDDGSQKHPLEVLGHDYDEKGYETYPGKK
jgi:hypothetical protein